MKYIRAISTSSKRKRKKKKKVSFKKSGLSFLSYINIWRARNLKYLQSPVVYVPQKCYVADKYNTAIAQYKTKNITILMKIKFF